MNDFAELNSRIASATHIARLHIDVDSTTGAYDLHLGLAESPEDGNILRIVFRDIGELHCKLDLGGWSQVHMLGIRQERRGHERPYVVEEIEYNSLSFSCRSASLL